MLKLVLKLPQQTDAKKLLLAAVALAEYKRLYYYKFEKSECVGSKEDVFDYGHADLPAYEPVSVSLAYSASYSEDKAAGVREYELDSDITDVFLMEMLGEMQKIVPFEMYFENRGKSEPPKGTMVDWDFEITDEAIFYLFWRNQRLLQERTTA